MIREMREKMQLSAESISAGICTAQKYSRIESGIDEPTESEFNGLMERLQEPALDYGDAACAYDSRQLSLRASLREAAALGRWERVGELMYTYTDSFPPSTPEEIQFCSFYETIRCYIFDETMTGLKLAEMCHSLILMVRPGFSGSCGVDFSPTQSEFLLMNAVAVGLSDSGDIDLMERAREILLQLIVLNTRRSFPSLRSRTQTALLLNLSIIELESGDYSSVRRHLSILLENAILFCGSYLYCRILICQYVMLCRTGDPRAAEAGHIIYSLFHINPEKSNDKVLVF